MSQKPYSKVKLLQSLQCWPFKTKYGALLGKADCWLMAELSWKKDEQTEIWLPIKLLLLKQMPQQVGMHYWNKIVVTCTSWYKATPFMPRIPKIEAAANYMGHVTT